MDPFSQNAPETVAALGEKQLLRRIRQWLGQAAPPAPYGMGDDCAILPEDAGPVRLITTDSVVLGRHFSAQDPPGLVGAKLLKRNLSDIAAMGGVPAQAVIAGFLPRHTRLDWLEACLRGIAETALAHGVPLVGGDLAESAHDLALNITMLGTGTRLLQRKGGQAGDWICLTGPVGGSRAGRHLRFTPRLAEGQALARTRGVHACIDVSDGLAIDLPQLLPEKLSAAIDPQALPIHPDARDAARESGRDPLWHALNDGEDHELLFLFTPDPAAWDSLAHRFASAGLAPPQRFGQLVPAGPAPILSAATGQPLPALQGYDHFR
jgi:thiamine-monophosphate kinase